jgi:hypothetical protein
MEVLWYVGYVESHFDPFGCKICARFAPNVPYAWKSFWTHLLELGDVGPIESRFGSFEDGFSVGAR